MPKQPIADDTEFPDVPGPVPRATILGPNLTNAFFRNIDADLYTRWKAYCARRGKSMTQDFIDYMKHCVRKGGAR